ncbi:helix-turn-helix transcriptional regulator [Paracraurococcus ruber]|uniref:HTH araC/xylS-type domain-containing protein n=1 Tax=Paracraurococcus ruber TaxID=77675 RepID=A0ABS1CSL9_9PROT|nr:AraC family transcriptional regulator [Paracraurococcus ruber]MBK1657461.1 hypothetical protein [Paracraurococcus ruber]TDG32975.1 AraC family transcriptional regulator [Paracraurococcus ruber]
MGERALGPIVYRTPTGAGWTRAPSHRTLLHVPDGPILRLQDTPPQAPGDYAAIRPPTYVHTLVLALEMKGRPFVVELAGRAVPVRGVANEFSLLPASSDSVWRNLPGDELTLLLNMPAGWLRQLAEWHDVPRPEAEPEPQVGATWPAMTALADMMRQARRDGMATPGFVEHWSVMAALNLLRFPLRRPARSAGLPRVVLQRVLDHIEANLAGDVGLVTLAGVAGLSAFHFARGFRTAMGVPPHAYVLQRRVARGKALLADRSLDLATIALMVGFAHQSHFTNAFRRSVGIPPGSWRRAQG